MLNCPFCGSDCVRVLAHTKRWPAKVWARGECKDCGAFGPQTEVELALWPHETYREREKAAHIDAKTMAQMVWDDRVGSPK